MKHLLEADGVQLQFGLRKILSDIYLKSETGKITGLLGLNGAGKSSLLKIIYGILEAEKSVRFDRISVRKGHLKPELLLYLPQKTFIPKHLSLKRVFEDFELAWQAFQDNFSDFTPFENASVGQLSFGELRLVELYIILQKKSQFALLDEPFSFLDPIHVETAKQLLNTAKLHKGIILTDQLYQQVMNVSDDLYLLANGKTHLVKHQSDLVWLGYVRG